VFGTTVTDWALARRGSAVTEEVEVSLIHIGPNDAVGDLKCVISWNVARNSNILAADKKSPESVWPSVKTVVPCPTALNEK